MLNVIDSRAARARRMGAMSLPIRLLLALGGSPDSTAFNVVGMVRRLLGRHGDERAEKVMLPFVWSKSAREDELQAFIDQPWLALAQHWPTEDIARTGSRRTIAQLRVADFPGTGALAEPSGAYPTYDIIHFAGTLREENGHTMLALDVSASLTIAAGALRDALIAAGCRLLILQVAENEIAKAHLMAHWIVESGGPSVLCVAAPMPDAAERYFVQLYLNVLHNSPLRQAVAPDGPGVDAMLYLGQDAEKDLQFDTLIGDLDARVDSLIVQRDLSSLKIRLDQVERFGHQAQVRSARELVEGANEAFSWRDKDNGRDARTVLRTLSWDHESDGVVPLSRVAEAAERAESYDVMLQELDLELADLRAPRVLNANFGSPTTGRLIEPHQPLQPGTSYDLLVDIGPRWNTVPSIVSGHAAFPEDAMPPDANGQRIEVVFASDAFEPRVVTGTLWLPSKSGRSHPVINDVKQEKAGPIFLRVTAPALEGRAASRAAHGRLCLYFENNLLQSAVVRATVAQGSEPVETPNAVEVDFVLTGGFRDVEQLATRDLGAASKDGPSKPESIGLNLAVNDDGGGTHRIIVAGLKNPIAFNYNPVTTGKILDDTRRELLAFFWKRDQAGRIVRDSSGNAELGLEADNGKSREGFLWDLLNLADQGSKLFSRLFRNVGGENLALLRAALAKDPIIQIVRTGPAEYVFPWNLVYDFPLTGNRDDYKFCPVVNEWQANGRRNAPVAASCPQGDHTKHENRICPYGFWGLRHRIEQPPSLPPPSEEGKTPKEMKRTIKAGKTLALQVALTSDVNLDRRVIADHVRRLGAIGKIAFAPPAAEDWNAVCTLLKSPQAVYFLCHGEFDKDQDEPYLGIGLRDTQPQHRIYPSKLDQVLANSINQPAWTDTAPLIFINGCHTTDLSPEQLWDFVSSFAAAGAGGVIGTEVSIRLPVATEVGELLFASLADSNPVTKAVQSMRWALANRGNLLGLAYTPYCFADLSVAYSA